MLRFLRLYVLTLWATLATRAQAHPITTSLVGASSGLGGGALAWAEHAKLAFALAAGLFGAVGSAIALLFMLPRLVRFVRAWRTLGFLAADQEPPPPPAPPA